MYSVGWISIALLGLAGQARADATFSLQWRDSGTQSLSVLPGDAASGGQRQLDLFIEIDVLWAGFGATVAIPEGAGVSIDGIGLWDSSTVFGGSFFCCDPPLDIDVADWSALDGFAEARNFTSLMGIPFGPPWAAPGTYHVGTLDVNTSALNGSVTIETFFLPGLDGLIVDDGTGSAIYSDDATFLNASLGTAVLFLTPEPATGGLVASGLLLLALVRRRNGSGRR
jgi:hypothetical protein